MTPASIQGRLSRWVAVQSLLGLSLICAVVYSVTAWSFGVKQAQEFSRHRDLVMHLLEEPGVLDSNRLLAHKLDDFFRSHDDVAVELRRGPLVLYTSSRSMPFGDDWVMQEHRLRTEGPGQPVVARFAIDVRQDRVLLRRLGWTLLAAAALGSLLVAATGALLVRRGLRPLRQLASETARTGPGHPGMRIDGRFYDSELQPWIVQFNELLDRVEKSHEQLVFFNADVAHEMRTPLANLISETEVVLAKPRQGEELRDALSSNLEEARRLSAIVTDMLFLSQADRGALALRSDMVDLATEAQMVLDYHEDSLEAAGLLTRVEGSAYARVDAPLVRRAISNLVTNAVRFARAGTTIKIRVEVEAVQIWILVGNQGPTVSSADLPRLFERFFRSDRSRVGSQDHHGLGLAIVSAVARMHHGRTVARSAGDATVIGFSIATATPSAQSTTAANITEM